VNDALREERLDVLFLLARSGDTDAFAEWMGMVEIPVRRSLRRFARAVDVEVVVQETLTRMWLVANDANRILEGKNASFKFALRVARNVALEEIRRYRHNRFVGLDDLCDSAEVSVGPEHSDPALGRAIARCIESLPAQPRSALTARIESDGLPDRQLADGLRMKLNTFLQNIVRARKSLEKCLEGRGVRLAEILS
jgi:DNA-directed RNA polymerase specialized sigma24 family protein